MLGWCLLSNHFPIVLWPPEYGDLSRWMQWLLTVLRYVPVEARWGSALRANLIGKAEDWRWSSLALLGRPDAPGFLHPGPMPRG